MSQGCSDASMYDYPVDGDTKEIFVDDDDENAIYDITYGPFDIGQSIPFYGGSYTKVGVSILIIL